MVLVKISSCTTSLLILMTSCAVQSTTPSGMQVTTRSSNTSRDVANAGTDSISDIKALSTTTQHTFDVYTAGTSEHTSATRNNQSYKSPPVQSYWTYRIGARMFRIYPFVFFAIGTVGNVLSLAVFMRAKMRKYPTYLYLSAIAVFDTIVLLTKCLFAIAEVYENSIVSAAFCKTIAYFNSFAIQASIWLIVVVTFERAIAIGLPLKASQISTRRNALICIAVIVFVFGLLNIHLFWIMTSPPLVPKRCTFDAVKYNFFVTKWVWIDVALYSLIPCTVLFVLNITVIVLMKKAGERMKTLTNQHQHTSARASRSKQITVTLLVVSFFFLICVTPSAVLFVYRVVYWQAKLQTQRYPEEYALYIFVNQILSLLFLCNHTFNFVLYAASGKRFREEFRKTFCCCCATVVNRIQASSRYLSRQKSNTTSSFHLSSIQRISADTGINESYKAEDSLSRMDVNRNESVFGLSWKQNT